MISMICLWLETYFGIDCPDIFVWLGRMTVFISIVVLIYALQHGPEDDDIWIDSRGKFFWGNVKDYEEHEALLKSKEQD